MSKKSEKENREILEQEKAKIVKTIKESDLDNESYMGELRKIEKIDEVLSKEEKPKMDGQVKAALIKVGGSVLILGISLAYELRNVWTNRTAENAVKRQI